MIRRIIATGGWCEKRNGANIHNLKVLQTRAGDTSYFTIFNVRSVCNKSATLKEYVIDKEIDLLAITETWLTENEKIAINDLCPEGYSFLKEPRKHAKGGGIGLFYRNLLDIKRIIVHQTIKTFEYMHVEISGVSLVHLLIVQRPPPSTGNKFTTTEFLQEFELLLNELVLTPGALLIAGDFNLH